MMHKVALKKVALGIEDEAFIRGKVPMTKEEVRVVALAKLQLQPDMTVVDVGAGTGSISIEVAGLVPQGKVYAIEMKEEGCDLIQDNMKKFQRHNIEVIEAKASEGLGAVSQQINQVDRVFIGGVGGELETILDWTDAHLDKENGRVVMNMILQESFDEACTSLRRRGYQVEACRLQVERLKKLGKGHYLAPLNGVYILWATPSK